MAPCITLLVALVLSLRQPSQTARAADADERRPPAPARHCVDGGFTVGGAWSRGAPRVAEAAWCGGGGDGDDATSSSFSWTPRDAACALVELPPGPPRSVHARVRDGVCSAEPGSAK